MNQLTLNLARDIGNAAADSCLNKAERHGFDTEGVKRYVVKQLRRRGPTSGEALTDLAKLAGYVPTDDRAFGPIYQSLARQGVITHHEFCDRRKGHGTAGGHVWKLI